MSVTFLIGGTGNQLFSYAASRPSDTFSSLFLSKFVRSLLNWTMHEQVLHYPKPSILMHAIALLAIVIDLPLAVLTGKTLFSSLDTRKLKSEAVLYEIARLGYFQTSIERRNVSELAGQISSQVSVGQIVLHVRGGDLLALERSGHGVYGILGSEYYRAGIMEALSDIHNRGRMATKLIVLTDDLAHAATLDLRVDGAPMPEILNCSLSETLSLAISADWFVSSNSTMAYWILRLRNCQQSVAPLPFQRRYDYPFLDGCVRLHTLDTR